MTTPAKRTSQSPAEYATLLRKVRETLILGHQRIEQEKVHIYWQTGDHILAHTLRHKERADYGRQVVLRLERDLDIDESTLRRCVQFREKYPKRPIRAAAREFTWSHYRKLITVSDPQERQLLEVKARRNEWSYRELGAHIKGSRHQPVETNATTESIVDTKPLTPLRGELYTYRLVTRPTLGVGEDSGLLIDLGFGIFRAIDDRWKDGDIIRSRPRENAYAFSKIEKSSVGTQRAVSLQLFTYIAFVERVIDGDTLKVRLDLGFGIFSSHTVRLRGIDCPEMDTKAGEEAKAFVQSYIKEAQMIIVRSSRSDKYDRYLADVFIPSGNEPDAAADIFLNNLLLEQGHAIRM